jgi:TPR repeat protein
VKARWNLTAAALVLGFALGVPAQGAVDEAQAAFDRGHYATAMRAWRVRAALGDANAQTNVGYLYEQGLSVRQDYAEALKWYRRASEAKQPQALHNLGMLYHHGYGVGKNAREAMRFFEEAAEGGLAESQYMLGLHYHAGDGVRMSPRTALSWFLKAAGQGYAEAQFMAALVMLSGDAADAPMPKHAYVWAEVARRSGYAPAEEVRQFAELKLDDDEIESLRPLVDICLESSFKRCPKA